jgi:hypothetical protein
MYSYHIETFTDKVCTNGNCAIKKGNYIKVTIFSFIRSKLIPLVVDYWYRYIFLFLKFNCVSLRLGYRSGSSLLMYLLFVWHGTK